ncbi:hypothetical protein Tcan_09830 [Toxocara canis]|uniref:Uncharacterized protein n=1 Tax=Toxocara canis TaxID=6265 RepID=A0A0B2VH39_TOXCA|nr:hypothetical protein Tcan_09830 [Toxocara canis]
MPQAAVVTQSVRASSVADSSSTSGTCNSDTINLIVTNGDLPIGTTSAANLNSFPVHGVQAAIAHHNQQLQQQQHGASMVNHHHHFNTKPPSNIILPPQSKPDPSSRSLIRRTSHTLLYVPEQRRVSTISGTSVASCPTELFEEPEDVRIAPPAPNASLNLSPVQNRRKSVQAGAPAIAFRPTRFERRSSQPLLMHEIAPNRAATVEGACGARMGQALLVSGEKEEGKRHSSAQSDVPRILRKRVSWLSMKSLQDSVEPLLAFSKRAKKQMASGDTLNNRNDSRGNSQYGSALQLDDISILDRDNDTPPLDTLSWSFTGISTC